MHDARPTVADLRELIRSPGPNNDLIELTAKQPRLAELTATVFPRAIQTLDRSDPVFEYARRYTPGPRRLAHRSSARWPRTTTPTATTRAFSRSSVPTSLDRAQNKLIGVSPVRSPERLSSRDSRPDCPGGATQPTPDGSAPWAVNGCEPAATPDSEDPPGP